MPGPPSDLVRDAASLLRFIRSIYGRQEDLDRSHRRATSDFLDYIRKLGKRTEVYLQRFVNTPPDPVLVAEDRQGLLTLRDFWSDLHGFVQPTRDADTLHIPSVFIELLEAVLGEIGGLRGCRLVISHTNELNYIQFPRSGLRERAESYADIVRGSPKFPTKLALIAMPYSQEANLFSNLLICHEMGHFVFEQLELEKELSPHVERILRRHLNIPGISELDLSWCRERLWSWAEEIYCDRFAIGLIGPAFSFSYIELFDVIGASASDQVNEFSDTHPSDACRFHEHFEQLRYAGWWPLLDRYGKGYGELVRSLHQVPDRKYVFTSEQKPRLARRVLKAFLEIRRHVEGLVRRTFHGREARFAVRTQLECVETVKRYLSWGVVPATLIRDGSSYKPDPVLLINAAYLFQLEDIASLIERVEGEGVNNLLQREKWCKRVEQWTLKALEDLRLPSRRKAWES
jgi:hypothetical protein